MENQKQSADIPKWAALLVEAVNKPGLIMEAYSAFHNYSIGNQILATCAMSLARTIARANQYFSEVADIRPRCKTWRARVDALHADHAQAT
jgi:hypothetical protein